MAEEAAGRKEGSKGERQIRRPPTLNSLVHSALDVSVDYSMDEVIASVNQSPLNTKPSTQVLRRGDFICKSLHQ
jgi:hypothetical protein